MSSAERKQKDASMASYMKEHPGSFPDSVMRPHQGNGADMRKMAFRMGRVPTNNSRFDVAVVGGILAYRLGLASSFGVKEYI